MKYCIVGLIALLAVVSSTSVDCTFEATTGVNFDLSPLRNDKEDYRIWDHLQSTTNQTFVFNICRDVVTIPKDGLGKDGCQKTLHKKDDQGHDIYETRAVPAFLISNSEEDPCHRVSSPLEDEDSYFLQRFDYSDPTAGVILDYDNGDYFYYWFGMYSMFSFRCSNNVQMPAVADVTHYGMAGYMIYLDSVYACPKECFPSAAGNICSGHGICMYDESVKAARCFCNANNKGEKCDKSVGLSMTNIFMILDIVAVLAVVITIAYFGLKLRKIRLDPEADVSLDTKFNELGSLAYTV
ncbi:hypothetical protein BLSTO_01416 [Blastocystis sp. subtype 1]